MKKSISLLLLSLLMICLLYTSGYMHLSMYYNQARLAEVYPADKYPFLTEKFAFVQKYLKDKYQIDLEAIANGPEDWDLPLPPIPETPDEE